MNLTKNFTLSEMLSSEYGTRHDIKEQFNPSQEVINNLELLCENILQPLRDSIGSIHVNSGYRCEKVNAGIGGVNNPLNLSQHVKGQAADLKFSGGNYILLSKIIELNLPYDQVISEGGTEENPAWIHVSYSSRNRRQILRANFINGKATYTNYKL